MLQVLLDAQAHYREQRGQELTGPQCASTFSAASPAVSSPILLFAIHCGCTAPFWPAGGRANHTQLCPQGCHGAIQVGLLTSGKRLWSGRWL